MGRHGGGSSSGGSRSSSSSSSSSSGGGSRIRTSNRPFVGGYNRSYYHGGKFYSYYTEDANFGQKSGWNLGNIIGLLFITFHMSIFFGVFFVMFVQHGEKINGNRNLIFIEDTIDMFSNEDEEKLISLFNTIYDKSGMPIMLYTDNFDYKNHYDSIEVYSEQLYYSNTIDENSMIILFTSDIENYINTGKMAWDYDFYCGDNTIKCLSDEEFNKVLDNFYKGMFQYEVADALVYAWNFVMDDLGKTEINKIIIPIYIGLLAFYSMFYVSIFSSIIKENRAYKYFKQNPEKIYESDIYSTVNKIAATKICYCTYCNTKNNINNLVCTYCGHKLKE